MDNIDLLIINYTNLLQKENMRQSKKLNISIEDYLDDLSDKQNYDNKLRVIKKWKKERLFSASFLAIIACLIALVFKNIFLLVLVPILFFGTYYLITQSIISKKKKHFTIMEKQSTSVISSFLASFSGTSSTSPVVSFQTIYPLLTHELLKVQVNSLIFNLHSTPENYKIHYHDFCNNTGLPKTFYFLLISFEEIGYSKERDERLWNRIHSSEQIRVSQDIENRKKIFMRQVLISVVLFVFFTMYLVMGIMTSATNSIMGGL